MRPLALLAVLAPAAAALEVLRAEGSPHDGACGSAGAACSSWNTDTTNLHRAARIASESASGPLARRSPNPACARARAAGVGQLVVHRQDGQHGSQTVRSSFSSSRRPRRARAALPVPRARIPRADASLIRKMVVEVSPHFVDWSGAQLFRILGSRLPWAPPSPPGRARTCGSHLVRPILEAKNCAVRGAATSVRVGRPARDEASVSAQRACGVRRGGGGERRRARAALARECLQPGDRLGIGFAPGELGGSRWWSMCRGRKQPTTTAHMGAVASRL